MYLQSDSSAIGKHLETYERMAESLRNHLFCFGLGYCATYLVTALQDYKRDNWQFSGTTRSSLSTIDNVHLYQFDDIAYLPQDITHMLVSIPPTENGDIAFNNFSKHIVHLKTLKWLGYLSSTGVYGDCQGGWVDENSEVNPANAFSKNRILAEEQWLSLYKKYNIPIHIFRLSGVYGLGRNQLEKVMLGQGQIIKKPNQIFSRVHVEDIAQILLHSIQLPIPGEIFNVADNLPSPPEEVMLYAYRLLNLKPPEPVSIEQAGISEIAKKFYSESKKIKNDKIKQLLKIKLKYPTYKKGLRAIFEEILG